MLCEITKIHIFIFLYKFEDFERCVSILIRHVPILWKLFSLANILLN